MADIAAFITARLNEDERRALAARDQWNDDPFEWEDLPDAVFSHARNLDPARVLREVAALRAIVAAHSTVCVKTVEKYGEVVAWYYAETDPCPDLRHLASIWADHPDYNEDWRS